MALALAGRLHRAVVHLDDVADDGEPEAEAALAPRAGAGALAEALEDVGQERGVDPGAGVPHGELEAIVPARAAPRSPVPPGGRELDGVGEQVPGHLLQAVGVADGERRPRLDGQAQLHLLGRGHGRHGVAGGLQHRTRSTERISTWNLPATMRDTSRMSSMSWFWTLALRSMVSMARARVALVELAGAQHVRPADDGGERRAQLVGEEGQELVLGAADLAGLLQEAPRRRRRPP